jgi:hypothetical protein
MESALQIDEFLFTADQSFRSTIGWLLWLDAPRPTTIQPPSLYCDWIGVLGVRLAVVIGHWKVENKMRRDL